MFTNNRAKIQVRIQVALSRVHVLKPENWAALLSRLGTGRGLVTLSASPAPSPQCQGQSLLRQGQCADASQWLGYERATLMPTECSHDWSSVPAFSPHRINNERCGYKRSLLSPAGTGSGAVQYPNPRPDMQHSHAAQLHRPGQARAGDWAHGTDTLAPLLGHLGTGFFCHQWCRCKDTEHLAASHG